MNYLEKLQNTSENFITFVHAGGWVCRKLKGGAYFENKKNLTRLY